MALPPERQQALRRRHRHERQAVVFGSLVAALAVATVGAAAVYTGVLDLPFDQGFSTPPPETTTVAAPPCPPEGTVPVPYAEAQVQVLNAAGVRGLAGQTAGLLTERGFTIIGTGNYPTSYPGGVMVRFGESGLAAAYTVAAQFEGAALVLDARADTSVDLVLGRLAGGLVDPAAVPLDPGAPLAPPAGCVPLEEALQQVAPAPAPVQADPSDAGA